MFKVASAIFSLVFVGGANAQSFQHIENCRQLVADADRLTCYDALKADGTAAPLKLEPAMNVADSPVKLARARFNVQMEDTRRSIYNPRIELYLSFENSSAKRVSALAMLITIKDAFGDEILVNDSKLDISIPPGGSTASNTYFFWEDNPFIHDDPYSRLIGPVTASTAKTEVAVKRIVYEDGSVESFKGKRKIMSRIERTETRKRGFFGMIFWWMFLAFNALMGLWIFYAIKISSEHYQATADAASQAGTAIGGTLAVGMLLWLWLFGDIILGLLVALSRGKKVTIERTIG